MKKKWKIATATPTGTYFLIGKQWGKMLQEHFNCEVEIIQTSGSIPNIQLVNEGKADFGFSATAALDEAWTGTGWAKGKKHENIRGLFSAYGSFMHGWTFQPDLMRIEGFSGKRITIGPPGGTSAEYVERIIRLLQIEPAEIINVDWMEGNKLLCSGGADAGATIVGPPQPSVEALLDRGNLRIIGFSEASIKKVAKELPFFFPAELPPGTYPGQEEPLRTVSIWNLVFCSRDMPDKLVFEIVKETFKNRSHMEKAHKAAGQISGKDAYRFPIPLHPGSMRYHKDSRFL